MSADLEPLRHNTGNAAAGGIWRVRGGSGSDSSVLKVAQPPSDAPIRNPAWQTSDSPTHYNYWRREVLAYETGFAASVYADAGIRVPRLEQVQPRSDGSIELWIEDVAGTSGFDLSAERLGRFAYELGLGQARWVGRVPTEAELPWLSRRWLAQYVAHGPGGTAIDVRDEHWNHSVAAVWPEQVRRRLRTLWGSSTRALAAAEALPRTLCHLDVWPANLIEDASGASVLLDWAFTGEGAIGEDPANLIIDSVTDGLMDAALLPGIVDAVTEGYRKGLTEGGSQVTADEVQAAIATCAVTKYFWICAHIVYGAVKGRTSKQSYNQDDSSAETLERLTGLATLLAQWADLVC